MSRVKGDLHGSVAMAAADSTVPSRAWMAAPLAWVARRTKMLATVWKSILKIWGDVS